LVTSTLKVVGCTPFSDDLEAKREALQAIPMDEVAAVLHEQTPRKSARLCDRTP
jgi:hypothetical protein